MSAEFEAKWWDNAIGYIIYPEAFKDSNGDGIGDIQGIISKLDYLKNLGINFICLSPIFASPNADSGYDISSYYEINPYLGDKEDLKELIRKAHELDIKVGLDVVINDTSILHPFFKKAKEDPNCKEASYYIFAKGRQVDGKLLPPNNWKGYFYESAWEKLDDDTFYLALFSKETAELDFRVDEVRQYFFDIFSYYTKLGIDAFKLSGASQIGKDFSLSDSSLPTEPNGLVFDEGKFTFNDFAIDYLRQLRNVVKSINPEVCLIGDLPVYYSPEQAYRLVNRYDGVFDLAFNSDIYWNNDGYKQIAKKSDEVVTNVIGLKRNLYRWYEVLHDKASLPMNWGNIDVPRILSMYGNNAYRKEAAKAILTTFLFMYGTSFLYQGEEIGMDNPRYDNIDDYLDDVYTRNRIKILIEEGHSMEEILRYIQRVSRINARSPYQWNKDNFGGFSSSLPKRKLNEDYKDDVNLASEIDDIYSIYGYYQYALKKRRDPTIDSIIKNGHLELLDSNHPDVFAYIIEGNEKLVLIASFRPYETYFSFYYRITDIILHNYDDVLLSDYRFKLRPFEVYLIKID